MHDHERLLQTAVRLIAELRNRRQAEANWNEFKTLIETNQELVITTFSSRWLISVCDTYADYGNGEQRRNALLISLMFGMMRLSDSLYEDRDIRDERVAQIRSGYPALYDGLHALNLDKQDTCLNLGKRLTRVLQEDRLIYGIFKELLRRAKANDNLLTRFSRRAAKPEWMFPENALEITDQYGVT